MKKLLALCETQEEFADAELIKKYIDAYEKGRRLSKSEMELMNKMLKIYGLTKKGLFKLF